MSYSVLIIVTNIDRYENERLKTGLWLSELTHFYHRFKECGFKITIASPNGGDTPIDPESLTPLMLDRLSKKYWNDIDFRKLLHSTKCLKEFTNSQFDIVYLTGGHGTMYDFPKNEILQNIIKRHYESGKIIAAICHGVCGLLNVKLSNNENLIKNKKITGFNWFEETLARRKMNVPFNLESELNKRTNFYKKALIPMTSFVVVDDNLITGQNPFSSNELAKVVFQELNRKDN